MGKDEKNYIKNVEHLQKRFRSSFKGAIILSSISSTSKFRNLNFYISFIRLELFQKIVMKLKYSKLNWGIFSLPFFFSGYIYRSGIMEGHYGKHFGFIYLAGLIYSEKIQQDNKEIPKSLHPLTQRGQRKRKHKNKRKQGRLQ